jgi:hypothetical protein
MLTRWGVRAGRRIARLVVGVNLYAVHDVPTRPVPRLLLGVDHSLAVRKRNGRKMLNRR